MWGGWGWGRRNSAGVRVGFQTLQGMGGEGGKPGTGQCGVRVQPQLQEW